MQPTQIFRHPIPPQLSIDSVHALTYQADWRRNSYGALDGHLFLFLTPGCVCVRFVLEDPLSSLICRVSGGCDRFLYGVRFLFLVGFIIRGMLSPNSSMIGINTGSVMVGIDSSSVVAEIVFSIVVVTFS
ncbi:hypothetical protein CDL15_Pgr006483 [Punica granatum]|uniref:Uncharacterized protein n=1 Tax=Punica granatum TaxID=22663 RepID=A0A218Y0T8_PUNGR|nr:hypothetical protein CDL15_Pgr006483 [Punica granatum]